MLVVDDWSLDGEVDAIHERFSIGTEILMRIALGKRLFGLFDSFFSLLTLLVLFLVYNFQVRLSQPTSLYQYFYSHPMVVLSMESVKLHCLGISSRLDLSGWYSYRRETLFL